MRHFYILLAISFFATSISAKIYTWTDKDGVTHFSESKPDDQVNISELTLLPVSATVPDSQTTATPAPAEKPQPVVQNQVEKQAEYQAPETATDKYLFDDRIVDQTDTSLENNVDLGGEVIDTIDRPRLHNAIVDGRDVSIKTAVKE